MEISVVMACAAVELQTWVQGAEQDEGACTAAQQGAA
jgi:hypothetical protein